MPENAVDLVSAKTNVGRALMSIAQIRALTVSTSSDIVRSVEVDSVSFSSMACYSVDSIKVRRVG
jgi:hypothetical protein